MTQSKDYRKHFRENLQAIRINFGYTQSGLSLEANYDSTYVGKLERGASDPSIETVKRLGEALGIDPLMLLSPNLAHLELLESAPPEEIQSLPFNPLDIEIIDSLPYPMGIITPSGTPVYVNDTFVEQTGLDRAKIPEQKIWELPFWTFDSEQASITLRKSLRTINGSTEKLGFVLELNSDGEKKVNISFYPSPRDQNQEDRGMWIFELRSQNPEEIEFPLHVTRLRQVKRA